MEEEDKAVVASTIFHTKTEVRKVASVFTAKYIKSDFIEKRMNEFQAIKGSKRASFAVAFVEFKGLLDYFAKLDSFEGARVACFVEEMWEQLPLIQVFHHNNNKNIYIKIKFFF